MGAAVEPRLQLGDERRIPRRPTRSSVTPQPPVAALRDVVRHARRHDSCHAAHAATLSLPPARVKTNQGACHRNSGIGLSEVAVVRVAVAVAVPQDGGVDVPRAARGTGSGA